VVQAAQFSVNAAEDPEVTTMTSSTTIVASFTSPGNEEDGIAGVSIAAAGICVVVSVFVASVIGIARAMAKPYPTDNMMGDTSQNKFGKVDEATGVEGLDKSNGKWVDAFCAQTEDKEKELRVAAEGESPATLSVNLKIPQRPWSAPGGSRRDSRKMKQKIKQKHIVDDDLIAARQRRQTDLALSEVDDQQEGLQSVTNSSSVQTLHPQHIQVGTQKKSRFFCPNASSSASTGGYSKKFRFFCPNASSSSSAGGYPKKFRFSHGEI